MYCVEMRWSRQESENEIKKIRIKQLNGSALANIQCVYVYDGLCVGWLKGKMWTNCLNSTCKFKFKCQGTAFALDIAKMLDIDVELVWNGGNKGEKESRTIEIGHWKWRDSFKWILISGRPDQVHNCTITNISMTSLGIRCLEGFNGGLTQSFMLEVRDMSTQVIHDFLWNFSIAKHLFFFSLGLPVGWKNMHRVHNFHPGHV